jgi:hypothetical protein
MKNYPRSSFVVLDMAGHGLQIEQAGLFNALVNEWLDRVKSGVDGTMGVRNPQQIPNGD